MQFILCNWGYRGQIGDLYFSKEGLFQGVQKIDREEVKALEINRLATTGKEFQMSNS